MKVSPRIFPLKQHLVELRSVGPAEAGLMLEHLKISHKESWKNLNRDHTYWEKVTVEEEEKILSNMESSPLTFMLGAFVSGHIVAGLGLFSTGDGFTKYNGRLGLSIQKSFQGMGLGRVLMTYAQEQAKHAGLHRIELTVRTYNEKAIRLYEGLGYRRVGVLRETALVDGKFEDEYFYELIL